MKFGGGKAEGCTSQGNNQRGSASHVTSPGFRGE
jgi:hypothetical protein